MSATFCPQCMKETDVHIDDRHETLPVRGEAVEVYARVAVCSVCGADVWLDELEDETLGKAFAEYRRRHGLLQSEEMRRIRQRWGLGQRAFAQLLGWGEITLHRYESGSLQDAAHDAQLRLAERPGNVRVLLAANGARLTARQRAVVEQALLESTEPGEACGCEDGGFETLLSHRAEAGFGGNAPLSLVKVREMIAYFAGLPDMYVTKLAKLMFYADFLHYREHTTSITGLAYAHAPWGPIPDQYDRIRADVVENAVVSIEERFYGDKPVEVLCAQRAADMTPFSQSEASILRVIARSLGHMSSKELSEKSHSETAWTSTANGERISYSTARDLTVE